MGFRFIDRSGEARAALARARQAALARGGAAVQEGARAICPVDTGALRRSIGCQDGGDGRMLVGTVLEYGKYVELGTGGQGAGADNARRGRRGQRAQPFLGPAARSCAQRFPDMVRDAMKKA